MRPRPKLVTSDQPPAQSADNRAEVARALLDRYAPLHPVLREQAYQASGDDLGALDDLENDHRYIAGRLQQALTALLARELPPLDATSQLLAQAITDGIRYRQRLCSHCGESGEADICDDCRPGWDLADKYAVLLRELGLTQRPEFS